MLEDLRMHLHDYCDHLYFLLGTTEEGKHQLVITADGDSDYFPQVYALVEAAPHIPEWNIRALKPALGFGFVLELYGLVFDPFCMWFMPLVSRDQNPGIGLRIGFNDYLASREQNYLGGTLVLLDHALGEEQMAKAIQYVEVGSLPENPAENGYIPLTELPMFVDFVQSKGNRLA